MEYLLILAMAVIYALANLANSWLFQSFEISSQISWVYLPAFLCLLFVLVLGRVNGFLSILLGGFLLVSQTEGLNILTVLNSVLAALAPVLACVCFQRWHRRQIELSSLRDLLQLMVVYCMLNALLHHLIWALFAPSQWHQPLQILVMMTGDLLGCLIGVGLMKAAIDRFGLPQKGFRTPPQE